MTTFLTTFFSPVFYKYYLDRNFMENKIAEDLGEEIISKLKELILILERKSKEDQNEKKCSTTSIPRN